MWAGCVQLDVDTQRMDLSLQLAAVQVARGRARREAT